jgi:riboflavin biosynthesis pyrimidine reductase
MSRVYLAAGLKPGATVMLNKVYPEHRENVVLRNLYLDRAVLPCTPGRPCVYTNYIASLDGRIALTHPVTGHSKVPEAITNEYDWRLYQELAAQADILITSGRYMRDLAEGKAQDELPLGSSAQFEDLRQWRLANDLPPQPAVAILTSSMDLPWQHICKGLGRKIYVFTTERNVDAKCRSAADAGAEVIHLGEEKYVTGSDLVTWLYRHGYQRIYAIAGPMVLETLIADQVLSALFLTQVHRIIGGVEFDTILQAEQLTPPADLVLRSMYVHREASFEQSFVIYDVKPDRG